MFINYKNEEIECKTTLRVALNIQKKFKKPYMQILQNIENLGLDEQVKILFCGIELANENIKFDDFFEYVLDEIGLDRLGELLEEFMNGIQYPGLEESEVEKKLTEKAMKQKKMREIGLIN